MHGCADCCYCTFTPAIIHMHQEHNITSFYYGFNRQLLLLVVARYFKWDKQIPILNSLLMPRWGCSKSSTCIIVEMQPWTNVCHRLVSTCFSMFLACMLMIMRCHRTCMVVVYPGITYCRLSPSYAPLSFLCTVLQQGYSSACTLVCCISECCIVVIERDCHHLYTSTHVRMCM